MTSTIVSQTDQFPRTSSVVYLKPVRCDLGPIWAVEAGLYADGYVDGALDRWTAADDADIAASAECSECGFGPLGYRPFTRRRDYIALSVCPKCGHVGCFS